jgi:hypothetical protein
MGADDDGRGPVEWTARAVSDSSQIVNACRRPVADARQTIELSREAPRSTRALLAPYPSPRGDEEELD